MKERKAYAVGTPLFRFERGGKKWIKNYIKTLKGFIGFYPTPKGMAWIFDTENHAKVGRNSMKAEGIPVGNVVECYVEEQYFKAIEE